MNKSNGTRTKKLMIVVKLSSLFLDEYSTWRFSLINRIFLNEHLTIQNFSTTEFEDFERIIKPHSGVDICHAIQWQL